MLVSVHHALLIRYREQATIAAALDTVLNTRNERFEFVRERFGVDDARELREVCSRLPTAGDALEVVVQATVLTSEAQNALLKLFEDPPQSTRIVLVVPQSLPLLPTLLSRCAVLTVEAQEHASTTAWDELCALPIRERLRIIEERLKAKDDAWFGAVSTALRSACNSPDVPGELRMILTQYIGTRGASNKQLLEAAALYWP